jgi:hypothetical protein
MVSMRFGKGNRGLPIETQVPSQQSEISLAN